MAPTRPHPHAPAPPPANEVAGPVAAAVDAVRDTLTGGGSEAPATESKGARRGDELGTGASGGRRGKSGAPARTAAGKGRPRHFSR